MTFPILSQKRTRLLTIIRITLYAVFVISISLVAFYESNVCAIIALSIFIFNLTPLTLLGKKKIGKLILDEKGIEFVTQEMEQIKLGFDEMIYCKFYYTGFVGQIDTGHKSFSWNDGENKLLIKTNDKEYKILFLGEVVDNKKMIIRYIDLLKENNVGYHFEVTGDVYSNIEKKRKNER